ncbi:NAD(P)-dependent dehydrogenase (short-subunit alcohol dehydrogenase family) [Neorhizobium galegae]|uniref:SDR family oxidoreductase n=1 Tax=Neorhizobium galegae TaxID=399 RepID=UPI001AEA5250|nr:SDR family oxidoreductase [Neorhizobium galegae]MBP2547351.1 NAD(P)-dependent dehydrogenase (short-subunit alcohol dehydrogenase family) [Neorhizobium galegae]
MEHLPTVLVTGAARRMGRAIVEDLAHHGYGVAIHADRSFAEAEQLAAELRAEGRRAAAVEADLIDSQATDSLIDQAAQQLGPITGLVNNASLFVSDTADAFDAQSFDRHFAIHVRAPSILSAALLRQLPEAANALIVNIIDQRVWKLTPQFYSYTLSKTALWTATQTLAQAYAPRVRVNAIGPGPSFRSARQAPEDFQRQIDALPLKRGPGPDEFGRTIRFLFDTPSITGQMIALDGGQHLAWQTPDVAEIIE